MIIFQHLKCLESWQVVNLRVVANLFYYHLLVTENSPYE